MKLFILTVLLVTVLTIPAGATIYDYIIEDGYFEALTLNDYETLLMTGGGHILDLFDNSEAKIEGTTPYIDEHNGGIWMLSQYGYSILDFSEGELHELDIASYATATFSGGLIEEIWSYQFAWILQGEPSEWVPNPHITFICDVESVFHNTGTNLLTGNWLDGSAFSIQLVDVDGYSPAIENILFIPEPATVLLLAIGGVLLGRKR